MCHTLQLEFKQRFYTIETKWWKNDASYGGVLLKTWGIKFVRGPLNYRKLKYDTSAFLKKHILGLI